MAKSKAQTHQMNGKQLSNSCLGTGIILFRKWWIKPSFIASLTSHLNELIYSSMIIYMFIISHEQY